MIFFFIYTYHLSSSVKRIQVFCEQVNPIVNLLERFPDPLFLLLFIYWGGGVTSQISNETIYIRKNPISTPQRMAKYTKM